MLNPESPTEGLFLWAENIEYVDGKNIKWLVVQITNANDRLVLRYVHEAAQTAWVYDEESDSIVSISFNPQEIGQTGTGIAQMIVSRAGLSDVYATSVSVLTNVTKSSIDGRINVMS